MVNPESSNGAFFMYLGPSIRGKIQANSLYQGSRAEVEQLLASAIEAHPRIKTLLVSGDTLAVDRVKVKTPGNYLYEEYRKFVAELKNKEV